MYNNVAKIILQITYNVECFVVHGLSIFGVITWINNYTERM